jgi:hypothetical protein
MTNRTKAIISLSSVFILGAICGALLFGVIVRDRVRETQRLRHRDGFVEHFARRLDLTEAQRDSLRDELEQAYDSLTSLRQAASERYNAVFDTLQRRIAPQLTDEQRTLFHNQEEKLRRMMPKEPRRRGGPRLHDGPRSGFPPADHRELQNKPEKEIAPEGAKSRPLDESKTRLVPDSGAALNDPTSPNASSTPDETILKRFDHYREKMRKRLQLRDEQASEIDRILRDGHRKNAEARKEFAGQPVLRRSTIRENLRATRRQMIEVLDAEQRKEFTKMEEEMWRRRRKVEAGRMEDK